MCERAAHVAAGVLGALALVYTAGIALVADYTRAADAHTHAAAAALVAVYALGSVPRCAIERRSCARGAVHAAVVVAYAVVALVYWRVAVDAAEGVYAADATTTAAYAYRSRSTSYAYVTGALVVVGAGRLAFAAWCERAARADAALDAALARTRAVDDDAAAAARHRRAATGVRRGAARRRVVVIDDASAPPLESTASSDDDAVDLNAIELSTYATFEET